MNYVLSAIPLYQFFALQAPKFILHQLGIYIRKFMWEGGNTETKKYHLVNWKIVRALKQHGGLGIRDPGLMNMVMRAKIFWIMTTNLNKRWMQVMGENYLNNITTKR